MAAFLCVVLCGGCQSKEETLPEQTTDTAQQEQQAEQEEDPLAGKALNPLTGLYIDEGIAARRPIAVTINNLHKALPQSGISQADIYYEALAEGEITRLIAVFQEFTSEKIGPVRSAREYFTYFALDNDALYIHHGGSETGYAAIRNRGVDDLDGMSDRTAFWRDETRANQPGMYEHSSYVSSSGILESWQNEGYEMNRDPQERAMFLFHKEDKEIENGTSGQKVTLPYSTYQVSQFFYNQEESVYERYQTDEPQIDEETGEVLTVKNILIQTAPTSVIDGEGRRSIELVGEGEGVYITLGKSQPIRWRKSSYDSPTRWYDEDGRELILNPGKTWICVYPTGAEYTVE